MKMARLFVCSAALTLLVLTPAAARADKMEDLEVTMEVLDEPADLDEALSKARSPDAEDNGAVDWSFENAGEGGDGEEEFEEAEVDFEMDDEFEEDREFEEDTIYDEDDFEDGEDVDDDFFD